MPDSHVHPDTRKKSSKAEERLAEVVKHLKDMRSNMRVLLDIAPRQRAFLTGAILQFTDLIKYAEHGE